MKISHFSALLIIITLLTSVTISGVFFHFVYLPQFQEEQDYQHNRELRAIEKALLYAQRDLDTLTQDYAVWDEMVDMIDGQSQFEALDSQTMLKSYELANIDAVYLFDAKGQIIFSLPLTLDFSFANVQSGDRWKGAVIPSDEQLASEVISKRTGYLLINNVPVYFSNVSVLPSIGKGKVAGSLMTLRILDSRLIEEIEDLTLTSFSLFDEGKLAIESKSEHQSHPQARAPHSSELQINDVFGHPAFYLRLLSHHYIIPKFFSTETIFIFIAFFIASIAVVIPISWAFLKPITQINLVLRKMTRHGGVIKIPTRMFIDEIKLLANSFNTLLDKIDRHQNYLESLSIKDPLTGIANRRGLEAFADRAFNEWQQGKGCLGFLMIDIDDFKAYNDALGHIAGDRAILNIAQTLMLECKRRGESVTRYGGEEFCVIIQGENTKQMEVLADRMLKRIRLLAIHHPENEKGFVSISIGGVFFSRMHPQLALSSWQQMVELADEQLYKAKSQGKDRLVSHTASAELKLVP